MGNYKRFRPKIANVGGVPRGNVVAFEDGVSGANAFQARGQCGRKEGLLATPDAADFNKIQ